MLSSRAKVLTYIGLFCSIITMLFRALPSIIPFSFYTYNLVNELYEIGEVVSFGLYLVLLILSVAFLFMDKKQGESTSMHRSLIIYTVLYVVGIRGVAPLCFPITALTSAINNKKNGIGSKSDTVLVVVAGITVALVLILFAAMAL